MSRLTSLRDRVLAEIEPLRKDKHIGSSLQAKVVIAAGSSELEFLQSYAALLPMLFIVSSVELREATMSEGVGITIERAGGVKCERCWRYVASVSDDTDTLGLCDRCQGALTRSAHV